MTTQSKRTDAAPRWWEWPAWLAGAIRPGLRAAVVADATRMRELPGVVASILLPLLAIGLPVLLTILQAGTTANAQPVPDPLTFTVYDVFTESLPFVVAALLVGLASPAAGALLVLVYAIGNLAVTYMSGELEPVVGATFGRLVSDALLWLLVVEIPLLGRMTVESVAGDADVPTSRRWTAIVFGAGVVAILMFAWAQAAPTLITIVYWTTAAWGGPFLAAVQPVQTNDLILAGLGAVGGLVLLAVRFGGSRPVFDAPTVPARSGIPGGPIVGSVIGIGAAIALLSGVISSPIDAAVLLVGLVVARPLARLVLSATRLAGPLVQLPAPVRLVLGFAAAVATAWIVLSILGVADWSRFSTAVIAIAISLFVVALFTEADQVAASGSAAPVEIPVATTMLGGAFLLCLLVLAFPGAALADNCGDQADCWTDLAKAALAVAGAAIFVAQASLVPFVPPAHPGTPSHRDEASPYGPPSSYGGGGRLKR